MSSTSGSIPAPSKAAREDQRTSEWSFDLVGEKSDINALKRWAPLAGCEIVEEQGRSILKWKPLQELDDVIEARSTASDIVAVLNGLLRTETRISRPVRLPGSGYQVRPDGSRAVHIAGSVARVMLLDALPDWAAKHYAAAEHDSNVRDALIAYGGEPSWQKLRHVFEIIRQDVGGEAEIKRLEWATRTEIKQFSVNANDKRLSGPEAIHGRRFNDDPGVAKMTLDDGLLFVGRLLNRWIENK